MNDMAGVNSISDGRRSFMTRIKSYIVVSYGGFSMGKQAIAYFRLISERNIVDINKSM